MLPTCTQLLAGGSQASNSQYGRCVRGLAKETGGLHHITIIMATLSTQTLEVGLKLMGQVPDLLQQSWARDNVHGTVYFPPAPAPGHPHNAHMLNTPFVRRPGHL